MGVGIDVVLIGEYLCVCVVDIFGDWIVFLGVGKICEEMCVVFEGGIC